MSNRRKYFHLFLIFAALVVGGLSIWHSGFWMEGRDKVPNFTAMAMVLVVISQGIALWTGQKENGK
jgi:hypothetical protein